MKTNYNQAQTLIEFNQTQIYLDTQTQIYSGSGLLKSNPD